jgi:hypothetical protein
MKFFVFILALAATGCALSNGDQKSEGLKKAVHFPFEPQEYVIRDDNTQFVLIDVFRLEGGAFTIGKSVSVQGQVEYFGLYPKYTETPCQGKGYTEEFEERSKVATNRLKLRFFRNGEEILLDQKITAPSEKVDVAVYAEYAPLAEFTDHGVLPVEYIRHNLTSGSCKLMCPAIALMPSFTPIGPKKSLHQGGCNYWISQGQVGNTFPGVLTDQIDFRPDLLAAGPLRDQYIGNYERCGVVRSNEDLAYLYERAAVDACNHQNVPILPGGKEPRVLITEIRMIGHKVAFSKPKYSVLNFSKIVQGIETEGNEGLKRRPVYSRSEMGK